MRQVTSLWVIVSISLVAISLFPVYTVLVLTPSFERLLVENAKEEAIRLARYLSMLAVQGGGELQGDTPSLDGLGRLGALDRDPHLVKMRIFSPSGEIVYSTDPTEVGLVNEEAYFLKIAEDRTARAEIIPKHTRSLENEVVPTHVVETYVPITRGERLLGIFEIYHDISEERSNLSRVISRAYGTLSIMAIGLLALVLLSSYQAHKSVKERARVEERLRKLSLTDDLTGLYNRRGFLALAEQQTKVANRDQRPIMVVSADLDGLKRINDRFGHKEGDAAIVETAQILRESFRDADLIARMGGDEFAVLLTGGEAEFDSEKLDARVRSVVEKHNAEGRRAYEISLSAGFASFDPREPHALEEWFHRADTMMYEQKRRRRGS